MIQIKMGNGPKHYAIDVSAIHKYTSNEFNDLYNSGHYKTELSADDLILLEDSDDGYSKKVIQAININSAIIDETAIHKNRMNEINSIEYTKDQLEENDIFVIEDSYQDPITLNQWEKRKITVSAINIDLISDGVTYKKFTTIEQTKLQGIEEGADVTDIDNVTLAENSINVSSHADITSPGADIEDAVTKRHVQGTDTTLGQQVQNIDLNNNIIKNSGLPIDDNDLISKLFLKSSSPMFLEPNQYLQHGLAIKDTLVYGDLFLIEDSEDGYNKKLSSFANFTFDPLAIHVNRVGEINGCDLLVEPIEWDDVLLIEDKSELFSKKRVQFQRIVTSNNEHRIQFSCETGNAILIVPSSGTVLTNILSQDIDLNLTYKVINSIEPTIDTDLATKYYVDTHSGNETLTLVELTETIVLNDTCYGNYYLCDTTSGSIIITLPPVTLQTKGKQVGFIYNKYISYNLSTILIMVDTGDVINNGDQSILLHPSESMIFVHDGIDRWSILNLQTNTTIHINKPKEIDLLTFDTPTTSDILLFENSHNIAEMWSKNKMEIGHITMDILSDGTNYVRMESTERTKLADITSSGSDIAYAVSKRHVQGTDITLGIQSQNSDWGTYRITNAGEPIDDNDYTTKYYVDDSATSKTENYFKNFVDIYSNTLSNYNDFYTSNLDLLYNDNIIIYDILVSPNGTIFACGLDTITSFACYIYKKPYETQFTRMVYLTSPNDLFGIPIKISCSPNGVINIINVCPSSLNKKSLNTTQDYPNVWYTSVLPYIDTGTKKNSLSDMIFHNEDKIFALSSDGVPDGNARIYKNNTEVFLSPFYDSEIKSFCKISSNEIIALYNHSTTIYNILYSDNAGNTWSIRSNIAYKFNKIIKTDQDTIIGILDHEIYKSIDNGVTFIPTPILAVPNSILKDIIYIGNGILIAAGNNISTSGIYFISYDFGNSWNVYQLSTNGAGPYDKIYFDSATMTMYLINTTGGVLFKGLFSKGFQNKILIDNFAIHLNGANEISGLDVKLACVPEDLMVIEDSEDGFYKKSVNMGTLYDYNSVHLNQASEIFTHVTPKNDIDFDDLFLIEDSNDLWNKKSIKYSNIFDHISMSSKSILLGINNSNADNPITNDDYIEKALKESPSHGVIYSCTITQDGSLFISSINQTTTSPVIVYRALDGKESYIELPETGCLNHDYIVSNNIGSIFSLYSLNSTSSKRLLYNITFDSINNTISYDLSILPSFVISGVIPRIKMYAVKDENTCLISTSYTGISPKIYKIIDGSPVSIYDGTSFIDEIFDFCNINNNQILIVKKGSQSTLLITESPYDTVSVYSNISIPNGPKFIANCGDNRILIANDTDIYKSIDNGISFSDKSIFTSPTGTTLQKILYLGYNTIFVYSSYGVGTAKIGSISYDGGNNWELFYYPLSSVIKAVNINPISQELLFCGGRNVQNSGTIYSYPIINRSEEFSEEYKRIFVPCEYDTTISYRRLKKVGKDNDITVSYAIPNDFKEWGSMGGFQFLIIPTINAAGPYRNFLITLSADNGLNTPWNNYLFTLPIEIDLTGYANKLYSIDFKFNNLYITLPSSFPASGGIEIGHYSVGGDIYYVGYFINYIGEK